jgi:LAO/AO transport system kinase
LSKGRINPHFSARRNPVEEEGIDALFSGLREGSMPHLARAISLVESEHPRQREMADALIKLALPYSGNAFRLGISGIPGAGKSTLIEALGARMLENYSRLAVLAVDPSSRKTGGSILGDKTRMELLSRNPRAYIRPSPAGTTLGGVARATREAMLLCEAAGYDLLIVETVGVGQSEIAVHGMCDLFIMVAIPGAGDELQGIKRGITEMADLILINKADNELREKANLAARQLRNAMHLFPPHPYGLIPEVITCSALEGTGIESVVETFEKFKVELQNSGGIEARRADQRRQWMQEALQGLWETHFFRQEHLAELYKNISAEVGEGRLHPYEAAQTLWERFLKG